MKKLLLNQSFLNLNIVSFLLFLNTGYYITVIYLLISKPKVNKSFLKLLKGVSDETLYEKKHNFPIFQAVNMFSPRL